MQFYGSVNFDSSHKNSKNLELYDTTESYVAGETPIKGDTKVENMGIAVFNKDKLVRRAYRNGISMSPFSLWRF